MAESEHVKNVQNFQMLISSVDAYGVANNPANGANENDLR